MGSGRWDLLAETVARYRALAGENYQRIRDLAQSIQSGFCSYLGSEPAPCAVLVPPAGPFTPTPHGDRAFSVPPEGFQILGPVSFGLAVRVTETGDWLRVPLTCAKEGRTFTVHIRDGRSYDFSLPVTPPQLMEFFDMLYEHIENWFASAVSDYEHGAYGVREMGFEVVRAPPEERGS